MIEPRIFELLNAELDGELDARDSAELQRGLAADPEARAQREHLQRIASALGRLPPAAPPAGLTQQVLRALPPGGALRRGRERRPQFVRYALALAAGMLIAAVGIGFVGNSRPAFEPDQLVGTMGRLMRAPAPAAAEVRLATPQLTGSVGLSPAADRWLLVFDLASEQPVRVTADYSDAAFRLNGYAQGDSGVGSFSATRGRISFVNQGTQRLALFLEPEAGGPVILHFETRDQVVQEAKLEVPGKHRH